MNKIVLGTAQFGMDYGINNKRGKIPQSEAFEILNKAIELGVDIVDTAYDYKESEEILGNFMKAYPSRLKIISKLPKCGHDEVRAVLKSSLSKLNVSSLYGYLIHNFENYKKDPKIWDEMEKLKKVGAVEKIGFSLYFPSELDNILKDKNIRIDLVQLPYNIFDQRFAGYFSKLKDNGVEIYVRSIFLQGLVFKKADEIGGYFSKIKEKIKNLNLLSARVHIPVAALCVNFAVLNRFIDRIVVGVDNIANLNEIVYSLESTADVKRIFDELLNFKEDDEKIILPLKWEQGARYENRV